MILKELVRSDEEKHGKVNGVVALFEFPEKGKTMKEGEKHEQEDFSQPESQGIPLFIGIGIDGHGLGQPARIRAWRRNEA
jgi:hypothetical protein